MRQLGIPCMLMLAITAISLVDATADEPFNPRTVIRRAFPAITKFPVISAEKAATKINDAELVLGVVDGKKARAYPINMLTGPRREILNDVLGGKAIAATW